VHAFVQRSKLESVPFSDLVNTARLFNTMVRDHRLDADADEKRALGQDLLQVLTRRMNEASVDDLGQMAWVALRLNDYSTASTLVRRGLELEPDNYHLNNLAKAPNIKL